MLTLAAAHDRMQYGDSSEQIPMERGFDMVLSDKSIKELADKIFLSGYIAENVNPASYDVTIDEIILDEGNSKSHTLQPDEMVFIKTKEEIRMPDNLLGVIGEKNSVMRLGLWVSGPRYFPGHQTKMFLRVKNISAKDITISSGMKIAQLFFEEMKDVPDVTYDRQEGASFNNEKEYRGLGNYKNIYKSRIEPIKKAENDLDNLQGKMYANILTLMGLFVSIFSLIMVNFSQINSASVYDKRMILTINLSLGFVIVLFMGLILLFFNREKRHEKRLPIAMCAVLAGLVFTLIVI